MAYKYPYPLLLKWELNDTLLFSTEPGSGLVLCCVHNKRLINSWVYDWNINEDRWIVPTQKTINRIMSDVRAGKYAYKDR